MCGKNGEDSCCSCYPHNRVNHQSEFAWKCRLHPTANSTTLLGMTNLKSLYTRQITSTDAIASIATTTKFALISLYIFHHLNHPRLAHQYIGPFWCLCFGLSPINEIDISRSLAYSLTCLLACSFHFSEL